MRSAQARWKHIASTPPSHTRVCGDEGQHPHAPLHGCYSHVQLTTIQPCVERSNSIEKIEYCRTEQHRQGGCCVPIRLQKSSPCTTSRGPTSGVRTCRAAVPSKPTRASHPASHRDVLPRRAVITPSSTTRTPARGRAQRHSRGRASPRRGRRAGRRPHQAIPHAAAPTARGVGQAARGALPARRHQRAVRAARLHGHTPNAGQV